MIAALTISLAPCSIFFAAYRLYVPAAILGVTCVVLTTLEAIQ